LLISLSRRFVFIANLKTASTSIERALAPFAEIRLDRSEWGKHAGLARAEALAGQMPTPVDIAPFRKFGIIRDPVEWLYSLYRSHRHGKFARIAALFTGRMDFDRFIAEWCERNADQCAPQHLRFLDGKGRHGLELTVPYEALEAIWPELVRHIGADGAPSLARLNESPPGAHEIPIGASNLALVREKYRKDYELLERSRQAGPVAGWFAQAKARRPAAADTGISRETVIWGYRLILDRDPESEAVIAQHQKAGTRKRLRDVLLDSSEFRDNRFSAIPAADELPPMRIELSREPQVLDRLREHLRKSWEQLGTDEPHYSVITDAGFLPERFRDNAEAFWASGGNEVRLIESSFARAGLDLSRLKSVLELGCGVGRATLHLSRRFGSVIATDVSAPHLKIARARADETGRDNIAFVNLLENDIDALEQVDLAFSRIVLQHNAPPLMLDMLARMLGRVKQGGAALFQLPVYMRGYEFRLEEFLSVAEPGMEMHCLPQAAVLRLLDEMGFTLLELRENEDIGRRGEWISNMFLALRGPGGS